MTQHSTRAASPPASNPLWGRLPKGPWPVRLILLAALLLAVPILFHAGSTVHAADNEITGVTLTSPNPGELAITWDAPSRAPGDYRVTWKKSGGNWPSYKNENTALGGNAFPTGTSHTVTGLEEGAGYSVRVRARYHNSEGNVEESGPWSDPPEEITVAQRQLPAKPTGLLPGRSHDRVLLFWDDPDDDTITGYQILRGLDADSLTVLTGDTGAASASYTDDTVEAETEYFYAIRARNAQGLGPQSDTVSVRTLAAPVEPESDLAVAGVDFIIAGQMMDTTGTCSEDDIDQIGDACTHDITNPMPQFGVVGTLDTDDRVSVRIGRDLAGLANVADQSDLQGANERIRLDLESGRHLMRIWGDENTEPGGAEAHFFRINVVPYWEWNGERLSKDSDCRDTTANAPTVDEITDDDCIVAPQFGNTAELRFFNVINEHFNVYVEVNGTNVISVPSTSDLGSSFTVNLDAGDNLIRIRLAAKGGQPTAEVYDSDSFYYKVTATDVLVSNLGQTGFVSVTRVDPGIQIATQFTTGGNAGGYTVSRVRLPISVANAAVVPAVAIYSDVSGSPGVSIKTLTNRSSITVSTTATTEVEFDAGDYTLKADTDYWIVVENPHASEGMRTTTITADSEDAGGAPNWSIGNVSKVGSTGGTLADVSNSLVMQIAVKGALVTKSDDATLSDLVLFDSKNTRVTLDPAFDSEVTEYTATVANEHTRGALDAQLNDVKAEVEFLDKDDATIPTAGMAGDVRYINPNFEVGKNVFKIKVTAEDGTTTKTYQVTVTRVDFLVSNLGQTTESLSAIGRMFGTGRSTASASPFTTGSNTGGYKISAVRLSVAIVTGTTPMVSIYSDNSGEPGTSLKVLDNPANIPSFASFGDVGNPALLDERDFDADDFRLEADTTYWVVIERATSSGFFFFKFTSSSAEDSGTAPGWRILDSWLFQYGNQQWTAADPANAPIQFSVKGEPVTATPPGAPASLTATPGNAQATLTWTAPVSDGGAAITKYQYRVSADGGSTWSPDWTDVPDSNSDSDQADERTLTVTGLANGTLHTFQVRAVNSEGSGGEVEATATPAATTTAPGAPASLTATPGDAQVTLTWTAPVSDGGAAIIKYQYRVSSDSGSTWNPDWTDVPDGSDAGPDLDDERTLTVTNLINGTLYTFQVRAVNSVGSGGQRQATATPGAAGTPPDLQSAEIDGATLTLQFSNTLDANSRPARSAFEVKVRGTAVSLSSSNPVSISGSTVTLRLQSAVTAGDTVTVSYTAPGANPIQDTGSLVAPSFTEEPVFNNTPNAEPTGRPVISGIPERGQTLTADTSGIRDADGLSNPRYIYRWGRVDGATRVTIIETISPTYLLTREDIGKKIEVYVSFHDDAGVRRLLVSDQFPSSGTIRNKPNRQPTGRPTLSGKYQVGHTLTASTSGIGDQDGLTSPDYTYQWQRRESGIYTDITGADQMVYTLTPDDQGKRVRVQVTFTDDDDNSHTLESFPSGLVQAQTSLPPDKVKVSLDATAYVVEEGDTVQVTVTLAEAPQEGPVYIRFTLTPENGATRSEFRAWSSSSSDSLRFAAGQTTDWIKIRADDDTLNDDGETITLCLVDLPEPYATLAGLDCATINILDNDDPNSVQVSFSRGNYWASEDGNPAWPRISVEPVPDREITIPITFTRGGSLSPADHGAVTTSVTFGPGLYGIHGDGHLSDNRTYASFPIEIWAIDDRDDDDGEYLDLAFGRMPDAFVTEDTGYRLGGDSREGFRRPANQSRVWFNDNEFTEVEVTDPPNPLGLSRRMKVTFADAELEAKEGLYEIGTVATVRVQLSRPRNKESTVVIPITVTRHGGARPGVDYHAADIPSQLVFLPGQTEQSFRVRAVNDDIDDDGEYLTLSFGTLPELVYAGDQATVRIDLVDDDDPPVEVFFEQANYEVTSTYRSGPRVYARLDVTVQLSAIPERFVDVGIVPKSIRGGGNIRLGYSAYIPRGPHSGAAFDADETEFTVTVVMNAVGEFDANQTYRLSFDGMSYKMFPGSPATATITINASP